VSSLIRPYADAEGIFSGLEYRANLVDAFQAIDVTDGEASAIVRVDDLRSIPQYELKLKLDLEVLKPLYDEHSNKLRLIIITRDSLLRRELRLADYVLDEVPPKISLDRALLKTTSHRDVLPLTICIVTGERLKGRAALPNQRASRLAELRFTIKNSTGGASFPFKRVTAEELREKGKPAETGLHLELLCEPLELITATDTPIAALLEVWIHEKVWTATQHERNAALAKLRLTALTLMTAQMLLSSVVPLLRDGRKIDPASIVGQLISHAEQEASRPEGELLKQFQEDGEVHALDPFLQNAWRFVSSAGKFDEDTEEES
jgi:hypothetical protein